VIGALARQAVGHQLAPDADDQGVAGGLAGGFDQLADDQGLAAGAQAKAGVAGRLLGRRHRARQAGPLVQQGQKLTVDGVDTPSDLVQRRRRVACVATHDLSPKLEAGP
jgi:hypothetical protein